ncbi:MAG: hypothetical protein LQ338_008269 [Usnochroma carphineum]|nr:MAG: hypothetical protein LQ338_008269 [Usnochroma carphineum]
MRRTQLLSLLAICTLVLCTLSLLRGSPQSPVTSSPDTPEPAPIPPPNDNSHPIHQLITQAEGEFKDLKSRQSQTLPEAVTEYRRRYKIPPPPNFDKWFEFAKDKNVRLIDEFDAIYHALLPFWALDPSVIRGRAREALGYDNALVGVLIRDGAVISAAGGPEWQQKSTVGMMERFVKHLPDMDLPFNVHDEPRVVIPSDDLSRLVAIAKDKTMPVSFTNPSPKNSFSLRPADLGDGKRFNEVKTTRFNAFAHQPTWTNSRMSCPPESPARALDETTRDDPRSFSFSDLGFISNHTAFSDICLSPSLQERFGFFNRPNAFKIVHDLFPIFSQSKISSFQDILYPSPWYWAKKVGYDERQDFSWDNKKDQLFWRGSTTGGFSRDGGWRHQHRQLIVEKMNALDATKIFDNQSSPDSNSFKLRDVQRNDYKYMFDVKFSHVGQCDPGDCDAQKEYFEVVKPSKQQDAWAYKYLLDMDGNAFSGRFYAFLKSTSMVYKMAIFREWHEEWLRPWVHYVPLSLKGDEYLESVRFFNEEEVGKSQARRMAGQSREWADQVLRNEDFEVWLFRLLLEYGRIVDDNRESIGFGIA